MNQINYTKTIAGIFFAITLFISTSTNAQTIINTFAGNGTSISSGDGGPSTLSGLDYPFAACVDDSGNVYIADCNGNRIRKVNAITGIITTVAGNGIQGFSPDGTPATAAEINRPQGVAVDTEGNIYFSGYNSVVTEVVKSTGLIKTIAGGGAGGGTDGLGDGGPATNAIFSTPTIGVAVDDSGNVYVADHYNARIRKITAATGIITSVVGAGSNSGTDGVGDGGPGTGASLNQPDGLAVDDSGNVYIADQWHMAIRKLTVKTGIITCIAGTIVGGNGVSGYSGDSGQATAAELDVCSGVAVDVSGNVYIADTYNNKIREVTKSTGIITTIAGNGYQEGNGGYGGYTGDGGPATSAELGQPYDVTVDGCGNIYSVESNYDSSGVTVYDNRVRIIYIPDSVKVSPNPATTCSGNGITLHASGAIYYKWSVATGLSDTTGDSVVASPTIATTYTLTGGNGCAGGLTFVPATAAVTIGTAQPLTIHPSLPSVLCGQSDTLTVSGGGPVYTWTPSSGLNDTTTSVVIANPTLTTIYTVTSAGSGGCLSTGTDTIIVNSALPFTILPIDTGFCSSQSAILYVSGGGSNFIWTPTSGITDSTLSGDSVTVSPTATITYTVTGINPGGCATSGTDMVTIILSPGTPTFTQVGDTLTSSSVHDNQWYRNDTLLLNDTSQNLTITIPGEYWVVVNNEANGCSTSSDSANIKLAGINQLSIISDQLSIYPNPFNNNIFIKINSSAGDIKAWNLQITDVLGRMVYSKLSLDYSNDIDLSNLSSGVYFITVINKTGRAVVPVVKQN